MTKKNDRIHSKQLSAAAQCIGVASQCVRSAMLSATAVQEEAARTALAELDAAVALLKDVLGK